MRLAVAARLQLPATLRQFNDALRQASFPQLADHREKGGLSASP